MRYAEGKDQTANIDSVERMDAQLGIRNEQERSATDWGMRPMANNTILL